ncbi:MAG TPA: cytochrome C oxidase subunit IV family protein [Opitutaceae bacterium]|nr:cytochrome C oxidase subunit IV family protein [Opitutaceae bacterium]
MNAETKLSTLIAVYLALIILLVLTALATALPPGPWSTPLALLIAVAKMAIIFAYFMRLRWEGGLVRLFASAGFFWLAIAGVLTLADYLTRHEL